MNAKELLISIKTRFDGKGTAEANRQLGETQKKAETAARKTQTVGTSINKVAGAAELFGKVMRGLGVVTALSLMAEGIDRLIGWFKKAETAAKALEIATDSKKAEENVGRLIKSYQDLKASASEAAEQIEWVNELSELKMAGERKREDARSILDEEREIAALDINDPEFDQKKEAIRARYDRKRALVSASNEKEDVTLQRQALTQSADQSDLSAEQFEKKAAELNKLRAAEFSRAGELEFRAKAARRYKWDIMGGSDVDTPLSQEYATAAAASKANAEKLSASEAEAAGLAKKHRKEAAKARDKADALYTQYEAGAVTTISADIAGKTAISRADISVSDARSKREAVAAEVAEKTRKAAERERAFADKERSLQEEGARLLNDRDSTRSAANQARRDQSAFRPGLTRSGGRLVTKEQIDSATEQAVRAADQAASAYEAGMRRIAEAMKRNAERAKSQREAD